MNGKTPRREGFTLIELLVVLGIIAVLIGLTFVGIQSARKAAIIVESKNNLKQIMLANHGFAAARGNRLPSVAGGPRSASPGNSVFGAILPFVEEDNLVKLVNETVGYIPIKMFVSPADPTIGVAISNQNTTASYAANAMLFTDGARLPGCCPDGLSNTIAFAEHYSSNCGGSNFFTFVTDGAPGWYVRAASFADTFDIRPDTQGNPPQSSASRWPFLSFQVAPSIKDCNPMVAQTPHSSGMLVALGDGSVHQLSPTTSDTTYWGMVSPSGGEALDNDW